MSREDISLFSCYGMRGEGKSYMEHLKAKDKEIERLNNIIKEVKQQLLNKKDIVEKSKYFKLVYTDEEMEHIWDKTIINKMDELLEILGDDENE